MDKDFPTTPALSTKERLRLFESRQHQERVVIQNNSTISKTGRLATPATTATTKRVETDRPENGTHNPNRPLPVGVERSGAAAAWWLRCESGEEEIGSNDGGGSSSSSRPVPKPRLKKSVSATAHIGRAGTQQPLLHPPATSPSTSKKGGSPPFSPLSPTRKKEAPAGKGVENNSRQGPSTTTTTATTLPSINAANGSAVIDSEGATRTTAVVVASRQGSNSPKTSHPPPPAHIQASTFNSPPTPAAVVLRNAGSSTLAAAANSRPPAAKALAAATTTGGSGDYSHYSAAKRRGLIGREEVVMIASAAAAATPGMKQRDSSGNKQGADVEKRASVGVASRFSLAEVVAARPPSPSPSSTSDTEKGEKEKKEKRKDEDGDENPSVTVDGGRAMVIEAVIAAEGKLKKRKSAGDRGEGDSDRNGECMRGPCNKQLHDAEGGGDGETDGKIGKRMGLILGEARGGGTAISLSPINASQNAIDQQQQDHSSSIAASESSSQLSIPTTAAATATNEWGNGLEKAAAGELAQMQRKMMEAGGRGAEATAELLGKAGDQRIGIRRSEQRSTTTAIRGNSQPETKPGKQQTPKPIVAELSPKKLSHDTPDTEHKEEEESSKSVKNPAASTTTSACISLVKSPARGSCRGHAFTPPSATSTFSTPTSSPGKSPLQKSTSPPTSRSTTQRSLSSRSGDCGPAGVVSTRYRQAHNCSPGAATHYYLHNGGGGNLQPLPLLPPPTIVEEEGSDWEEEGDSVVIEYDDQSCSEEGGEERNQEYCWDCVTGGYLLGNSYSKEHNQRQVGGRMLPPAKFPLSISDSTLCDSTNTNHSHNHNGSTKPTPFEQHSLREETSGENGASPLFYTITLLERLVKTHPVWYLQHLGRAAATHLLRAMEPGVFIVRGSSRSSIVIEGGGGEASPLSPHHRVTRMALSVRLPAGKKPKRGEQPQQQQQDVDHYLIEPCEGGGGVRLEGSPNVFRSLPHLLEHYSIHGEELQTVLTLPPAIQQCKSMQQLQALALMGQDFWTSDAARNPKQQPTSTPTKPTTTTTTTTTMRPSIAASTTSPPQRRRQPLQNDDGSIRDSQKTHLAHSLLGSSNSYPYYNHHHHYQQHQSHHPHHPQKHQQRHYHTDEAEAAADPLALMIRLASNDGSGDGGSGGPVAAGSGLMSQSMSSATWGGSSQHRGGHPHYHYPVAVAGRHAAFREQQQQLPNHHGESKKAATAMAGGSSRAGVVGPFPRSHSQYSHHYASSSTTSSASMTPYANANMLYGGNGAEEGGEWYGEVNRPRPPPLPLLPKLLQHQHQPNYYTGVVSGEYGGDDDDAYFIPAVMMQKRRGVIPTNTNSRGKEAANGGMMESTAMAQRTQLKDCKPFPQPSTIEQQSSFQHQQPQQQHPHRSLSSRFRPTTWLGASRKHSSTLNQKSLPIASSKDDAALRNNEESRTIAAARQAAFRRTNTDLSKAGMQQSMMTAAATAPTAKHSSSFMAWLHGRGGGGGKASKIAESSSSATSTTKKGKGENAGHAGYGGDEHAGDGAEVKLKHSESMGMRPSTVAAPPPPPVALRKGVLVPMAVTDATTAATVAEAQMHRCFEELMMRKKATAGMTNDQQQRQRHQDQGICHPPLLSQPSQSQSNNENRPERMSAITAAAAAATSAATIVTSANNSGEGSRRGSNRVGMILTPNSSSSNNNNFSTTPQVEEDSRYAAGEGEVESPTTPIANEQPSKAFVLAGSSTMPITTTATLSKTKSLAAANNSQQAISPPYGHSQSANRACWAASATATLPTYLRSNGSAQHSCIASSSANPSAIASSTVTPNTKLNGSVGAMATGTGAIKQRVPLPPAMMAGGAGFSSRTSAASTNMPMGSKTALEKPGTKAAIGGVATRQLTTTTTGEQNGEGKPMQLASRLPTSQVAIAKVRPQQHMLSSPQSFSSPSPSSTASSSCSPSTTAQRTTAANTTTTTIITSPSASAHLRSAVPFPNNHNKGAAPPTPPPKSSSSREVVGAQRRDGNVMSTTTAKASNRREAAPPQTNSTSTSPEYVRLSGGGEGGGAPLGGSGQTPLRHPPLNHSSNHSNKSSPKRQSSSYSSTSTQTDDASHNENGHPAPHSTPKKAAVAERRQEEEGGVEEGDGGQEEGEGEEEEEDSVSLAGTDFAEPWDSNAWENLLDLAGIGDGRLTSQQALSTLQHTAANNSNSNGRTSSQAEQGVNFRRNPPPPQQLHHQGCVVEEEEHDEVDEEGEEEEEEERAADISCYDYGYGYGGEYDGGDDGETAAAMMKRRMGRYYGDAAAVKRRVSDVIMIGVNGGNGEGGEDKSRDETPTPTEPKVPNFQSNSSSTRRNQQQQQQPSSGTLKRQISSAAAAMNDSFGSEDVMMNGEGAAAAEDGGVATEEEYGEDPELIAAAAVDGRRQVEAMTAVLASKNGLLLTRRPPHSHHSLDEDQGMGHTTTMAVGGGSTRRSSASTAATTTTRRAAPPPPPLAAAAGGGGGKGGGNGGANRSRRSCSMHSINGYHGHHHEAGGRAGNTNAMMMMRMVSPLSLQSPLPGHRPLLRQHHQSLYTRCPATTFFPPASNSPSAYSFATIGTTSTSLGGSSSFFGHLGSSSQHASARLQQYIECLATDERTLFGATLHRFIDCTLTSTNQDPWVVARRVRQFLNGMKNYLVKNGELELHHLIERESDRLAANEFLNIDAIFEEALTRLLLVPIKPHLCHLMLVEQSRNGALQSFAANLQLVRGMDPVEELGLGSLAAAILVSDPSLLEAVRGHFRRMQQHYCPTEKLHCLVGAISAVTARCGGDGEGLSELSIGGGSSLHLAHRAGSSTPLSRTPMGTPIASKRSLNSASGAMMGGVGSMGGMKEGSEAGHATTPRRPPPAEDLIRWLIYLMAKCSLLNAELEAWYMWELLPQRMLTSGTATYYLSALFSAIQVLKSEESIRRLNQLFEGGMVGDSPLITDAQQFNPLPTSKSSSQASPPSEVSSSDAFLRVVVPDELEGSIHYLTLPIAPQMNVGKLCKVIAHQLGVTNPEDYGLYCLFDGFETFLLAGEYPLAVREQLTGGSGGSGAGGGVAGSGQEKPHMFVYKRNDARIAWPRNAITTCTTPSIDLCQNATVPTHSPPHNFSTMMTTVVGERNAAAPTAAAT